MYWLNDRVIDWSIEVYGMIDHDDRVIDWLIELLIK